ncbi:MAG: hypothetical protein HY606_05900 [Planctomycetes bacterium]|nr:hypothetical protein [Planctomycetota bacterium]
MKRLFFSTFALTVFLISTEATDAQAEQWPGRVGSRNGPVVNFADYVSALQRYDLKYGGGQMPVQGYGGGGLSEEMSNYQLIINHGPQPTMSLQWTAARWPYPLDFDVYMAILKLW